MMYLFATVSPITSRDTQSMSNVKCIEISLTHSCTFLAWIQNTFNFSEADKKVKEIAKQNE